MMTCPLPVDWLDLLEGRPSLARRAHLTECASCRAVIDALTESELREPTITGDFSDAVPPVLDDAAGALARWQIRWLEPSGADIRVPVVVNEIEDGDDNDIWVDIVPLWSDRENATAADLLLESEDTT